MKAQSKAEARRRRKSGRYKKPVEREPNGRAQRVEGETLLTNLEIAEATWKRRQMNPGLSPEEARKQLYGSVIHMWLAESNASRKRAPDKTHPNNFTQLHCDTAESYAALHARWLSAIDAKRMRSSSEFGGVGGHPPDPFITEIARREEKTIEAFKAARKAILASGPLGMMAIETIVIENQPAVGMMGDLRQALNALAAIMKYQNAA